MVRRWLRFVRNPHFWLICLAFAGCAALHYPAHLPISRGAGSLIGLERHAIERILFLLPVTYAAFAFGLRGGLIALAAAAAFMLPRVFLVSQYPRDALFETLTVIGVGILINWWLEGRRRELGRREQALLKLESARRELQSYVQVIKENERRISALHSISTAVNRSLVLEEVLDLAAQKIEEVTDIDVVMVFSLDEKAGRLVLKTHKGISDGCAARVAELGIGEGLNAQVTQEGEPHFVELAADDPRLPRGLLIKEGIASLLVVPLRSKDRVVGTLCVGTRADQQLSPAEKDLLSLIGNELGVGAEKASLFQELQRVGERFQEIFEKAHDAIWIQDPAGKILAANRAASRLTGFEVPELIGRDVSPFYTPEGLRLAEQVEQSLLSEEKIRQPYEQKIVRKSGAEATLMCTTSLLGDERAQAFLHIARDITDERRLQQSLRLYADQISRAHEEERKRIARELHDDTIQTMVALSRRLDNFISSSQAIPQEAFVPLEKLQEEIGESLARLRHFVQDLRPPTLEYLGLLPALRELAAQGETQSGVKLALNVTGAEWHFAPEEGLLIYRVVQEAVRNVWKHSHASSAKINVRYDEDLATIAVADNGNGFEAMADSRLLEMGKLGLTGMRERAHLLGGDLNITSKPGAGTQVVLTIPKRR